MASSEVFIISKKPSLRQSCLAIDDFIRVIRSVFSLAETIEIFTESLAASVTNCFQLSSVKEKPFINSSGFFKVFNCET